MLIDMTLSRTWCEAVRTIGGLDLGMHARLGAPKSSVTSANGTVCRIEASPREWDALWQWCLTHNTVPPGSTLIEDRRAARIVRLLAKIEDFFSKLSRHPGYRGRGIKGVSRVALPAFRCKGVPQARWWPLPSMAIANATGNTLEVEECILLPETKMARGTRVTMWRRSDPNSSGVVEMELAPRDEAGDLV